MFDHRKIKKIDLNDSICLKDQTTYQINDSVTGKKLVAKLIAYYNDKEDIYLISEFRKLALLSSEPEIGTVYYLATAIIKGEEKSCYLMDFIDGYTLEEFLAKNEHLSYDICVDIIMQIASGIEKAHHYEIFHSDLHNGNVLINKLGFIKIIDFLWWDYKIPAEENLKNDLSNFNRIASELFVKCRGKDKERGNLIIEYCLSKKSFKGIRNDILLLNEISFDLSLIDQNSKNTLSVLFDLITEDFSLNMVIQVKEQVIPDKYISELNEVEDGYIERIKTGTRLQYFDSRQSRIQAELDNLFIKKLFSLKQALLIDWNIMIENTGDVFIGPYLLNYEISLTVKALKWKKINESIQILKKVDMELEAIMIE